jgi:polyisoprenoid-binding protein YceI
VAHAAPHSPRQAGQGNARAARCAKNRTGKKSFARIPRHCVPPVALVAAVRIAHSSLMRALISTLLPLLTSAAFASIPANALAAARDFRFDTVHTQVMFSLSHLGYSHPNGRLHVASGFIRFDEDDWSTAQVDVVVDAASVDMGDAKWNDKLRSSEFFATERYPTARFVSSRIEKTGERTGVVHGKLTLLGITRAVDLAVKFNRAGIDPYTFKSTVGFSATAAVKRSDFGMNKYLPDIGDAVDIRIEVEGLRDKDAQRESDRAAGSSNPDSTEH